MVSMKNGIYKKCLNCGVAIYVKPSELTRKKYCSKKCLSVHKTRAVVCDTCGKGFIKKQSVVMKHTFCSNACKHKWTKTLVGSKHNSWKGGRRTSCDGYIYLYLPEHPLANKRTNYYAEHRYICENILGRCLTVEETPHHINGNKSDNRPQNIYLFPTRSSHVSYHNFIKSDKTKMITKSNLLIELFV